MHPQRYFRKMSAEENLEFKTLGAVSPLGSDRDNSDLLVTVYSRDQIAY